MTRSLVAALAALLILAALPAFAQTAPTAPTLLINGQQVTSAGTERAPNLHNGRLYVSVDAFAKAIGAEVMEDHHGVVTVKTGFDLPNVAELTRLNPKIAAYEALSPYIPGMGIHLGVAGPHVTLAVSKEGTINAAEAMFPAQAGWFPWFDQPEGQPIEIPGMGKVYTQHIYLTNPAGLTEDAGQPVILAGRFVSYGWEPKPHRHKEKAFIPVRAAVELLGGSVTWDPATWVATATVNPQLLSWKQLSAMNPTLQKYQALSEFVPNMGVHMGVPGPHLTVLVDSASNVVGFEMTVPATSPWMPWFDQPQGQPMELPGLGKVYSQHVYLAAPASIK